MTDTLAASAAAPALSEQAAERAAMRLNRWQLKLLPFMMVTLVLVGIVFFVATLRNYADLRERLNRPLPDIALALDKLQAAQATDWQRDWTVRVLLEDRALRSRREHNAAVVEARVWTRFMGFMTGMVMVLAGCIFILGRLEASFDGRAKVNDSEGAFKTNSPGLVLTVAGTVLIAISLTVTVQVELNDRPVYLGEAGSADAAAAPKPRPPLPLEAPSAAPAAVPPASAASRAADYPQAVQRRMCEAAGKPPDCMAAK